MRDAKKAAEWYHEKPGFDSDAQGHWVTVWAPGSAVRPHLREPCPQWEDDEPGGHTGIAFATDDQERTYLELKEKGVEFAKDLTTEWFGRYKLFKDLDRNVLRI